jgi:hypothetical protein
VDTLSSSVNCGSCGVTCPSNQECGDGVCTVAYSASFEHLWTYRQSPTCTAWNDWRATLTAASYKAVTIRGSNDPVGVTCRDAAKATAICTALRTGGTVGFACGGRNWMVGVCGIADSIELNADGEICGCATSGYAVRPCIQNTNWGGARTATCDGPTQEIEVFCQ